MTLFYSVGRRSFSRKIQFGDPGTEAKWRVLEQSVRGWVLDSTGCRGCLSPRWIWSTDQNQIKGKEYIIYQWYSIFFYLFTQVKTFIKNYCIFWLFYTFLKFFRQYNRKNTCILNWNVKVLKIVLSNVSQQQVNWISRVKSKLIIIMHMSFKKDLKWNIRKCFISVRTCSTHKEALLMCARPRDISGGMYSKRNSTPSKTDLAKLPD